MTCLRLAVDCDGDGDLAVVDPERCKCLTLQFVAIQDRNFISIVLYQVTEVLVVIIIIAVFIDPAVERLVRIVPFCRYGRKRIVLIKCQIG